MEWKQVDWKDIDIRLAVGEPEGDRPIRMLCPDHIHHARIAQKDLKGSLQVYPGNVHCYGCGFHLYRRYASLAFLLDEWDGLGDENSEKVKRIVKRVWWRLKEFEGQGRSFIEAIAPEPLSPLVAESFHRYLLHYQDERMVDELMIKRGYSFNTIKQYKLGHTGTHFTIPVYDRDGGLLTLRYRADDKFTDPEETVKYTGMWRRNQPALYPVSVLDEFYIPELWVVEGELDAISSNQAGKVAITITNGATNIGKVVDLLYELLPHLAVGQWIIATDQDGAGDRAAGQVAGALSRWFQIGSRARWPNAKDLTEFYAAGGRKEEISYEPIKESPRLAS